LQHEQINDRTVALAIKGVKLTARLLAKAMQEFLKMLNEPNYKHGKQSVSSLSKHGTSLADAEIDGTNIASFKRIAHKYNIDFALKKDTASREPRWIVFFKAKDSRAIESAFNEYGRAVMKYKDRKPSIIAKLQKFKELAKNVAAPVKNRNRGGIEH
jgi:hypothetical protein